MNSSASATVTIAMRSTDGVIVIGDTDVPPNSRNPSVLSITWASLLPTGTPPTQAAPPSTSPSTTTMTAIWLAEAPRLRNNEISARRLST